MHFCTKVYTALPPEGKKKFKDVLKRNAHVNMWTKVKWKEMWVGKTAQREAL